MKFAIEIKTIKGEIINWVNGGIYYDEKELAKVTKKLDSDKRVAEYKVIQK